MKPADPIIKGARLSANASQRSETSVAGERVARWAAFVDHVVTARRLRASTADRVRS